MYDRIEETLDQILVNEVREEVVTNKEFFNK